MWLTENCLSQTHQSVKQQFFSCAVLCEKRNRPFKTFNCTAPCLVDILCVFCGFQKGLVETHCNHLPVASNLLSNGQWPPLLIFTDCAKYSTTFLMLALRIQPLVFWHRGHLGNKSPEFAFTCTFYYHAHTHMIPPDGWFSCYLGTKIHTSYTANSAQNF